MGQTTLVDVSRQQHTPSRFPRLPDKQLALRAFYVFEMLRQKKKMKTIVNNTTERFHCSEASVVALAKTIQSGHYKGPGGYEVELSLRGQTPIPRKIIRKVESLEGDALKEIIHPGMTWESPEEKQAREAIPKRPLQEVIDNKGHIFARFAIYLMGEVFGRAVHELATPYLDSKVRRGLSENESEAFELLREARVSLRRAADLMELEVSKQDPGVEHSLLSMAEEYRVAIAKGVLDKYSEVKNGRV